MHIPLGTNHPAFPTHLDTLSWAIRRAADVTRYLCRGREDRFLDTSQDSQRGSRTRITGYDAKGRRRCLTPEPWEMTTAGGIERGGGLEGSWELVGPGEGKGGEDWRLLQYEGGELGWCDQGGITTRALRGDGEAGGLEGEAAWEEVYVVPFFDWYGDEDDEDVTPAIWGAGCGCKLCMEVPVWVESPVWKEGTKKDEEQKQQSAEPNAAAHHVEKERGPKSHHEEKSQTSEDEHSSNSVD